MKTTTQTAAQQIEIIPARPIEIPQIEVIFTMPRKWFNFVNAKGITIAHLIDRFCGSRGRLNPEIKPVSPDSFSLRIAKHGNAATKAMNSKTGQRVAMTIRRQVWEHFLIQAENVGQSPLFVMMILIAKAMEWEKESGDEIRDCFARIRDEKIREQAFNMKMPLDRVVEGPWS